MFKKVPLKLCFRFRRQLGRNADVGSAVLSLRSFNFETERIVI